MRVLVCHVRYAQPGGEDAVFETEVDMLRAAGMQPATLDLCSRDLPAIPLASRVRMAFGYADHGWGRRLIREAVARHRPDVVHFHNLYPQLGPGSIAEADRLGCATLQTLHNYRLSCLTGRYMRNGEICDSCRPAHFAAGICSACYRGSRAQGLLVSRASARQWHNFVSCRTPLYWLALSPFVRDFYVGLGAPAERILVKANSVDRGRPASRPFRSGVFCGGRLSPEKGIVPLMRAWPNDAPVLSVAGDGPSRDDVRAAVKHNVRFLGRLESQAMRAALRTALVVVMPSMWPEPLPLVALEAFSEGTPVVAFEGWSLGAVASELASRCVVTYRDFAGLAQRAADLAAAPDWTDLSRRCIELWESKYSHSVNRESLLNAYSFALALKHGPVQP